jgi:mono/diheme cytochrome c family protein
MKGGNMNIVLTILFAGGLFAATNAQSDVGEPLLAKPDFDMKLVTRGQYLLKTSGCNDCHTRGYMQSEGKVPDDLWLTGDAFGWRGPWGTAKAFKARPPMPWFNLNAMTTDDLSAMYQFISYLGPSGKHAPPYVSPDQEPTGPHAVFPAPPK